MIIIDLRNFIQFIFLLSSPGNADKTDLLEGLLPNQQHFANLHVQFQSSFFPAFSFWIKPTAFRISINNPLGLKGHCNI